MKKTASLHDHLDSNAPVGDDEIELVNFIAISRGLDVLGNDTRRLLLRELDKEKGIIVSNGIRSFASIPMLKSLLRKYLGDRSARLVTDKIVLEEAKLLDSCW